MLLDDEKDENYGVIQIQGKKGRKPQEIRENKNEKKEKGRSKKAQNLEKKAGNRK